MRRRYILFTRWQIFLVIVTILLLGVYIGSLKTIIAPPPLASPRGQNSPAENIQPKVDTSFSFASVAERASWAVVRVTSYYKSNNSSEEKFIRDFFGMPDPGDKEAQSFGSGFFIDPNGTIITNEHVVRNANRLEITIKGEKTPLTATIIGVNQELDLALLKINGKKNLPYLRLGNSDKIRLGEWVIAIGNPMGLDHTVTVGVVSAKDRPIATQTEEGPRTYRNLIQTDAAINPGNSGGPLINTAGEVIGINAMVMDVRSTSAVGIGFAIAVNTAKNNLTALKEGGDTAKYKGNAWLGVSVANLDDNYRVMLNLPIQLKGVVITKIIRQGPAAKAGLIPGDVIVSIDGSAVNNISDYKGKLKTYDINQTINVKVYRYGRYGLANIRLTVPPTGDSL